MKIYLLFFSNFLSNTSKFYLMLKYPNTYKIFFNKYKKYFIYTMKKKIESYETNDMISDKQKYLSLIDSTKTKVYVLQNRLEFFKCKLNYISKNLLRVNASADAIPILEEKIQMINFQLLEKLSEEKRLRLINTITVNKLQKISNIKFNISYWTVRFEIKQAIAKINKLHDFPREPYASFENMAKSFYAMKYNFDYEICNFFLNTIQSHYDNSNIEILTLPRMSEYFNQSEKPILFNYWKKIETLNFILATKYLLKNKTPNI